MKYSIIEVSGGDVCGCLQRMVKSVNEYFEAGWDLKGELKVFSDKGVYRLLQPMVKEEN